MSLRIVEEIGKLSIVELAKLIEEIQTTFGVSAVMQAAPAAQASQVAAPAEEKTQFKVTLKEGGPDKLKAIKALRSVTTLSLKDAKDMVEGAPSVIAEAASKEDAQKIKEALETAGAKIELS